MSNSYVSFFVIVSLWSYAGTQDEIKEVPTGKDLFKNYDTFLRKNESADTALYDIADGLLDREFFEKTSHMELPRIKSTFIQLFTRNFGLVAWLKDRKVLAHMADTLYETIMIDRGLKRIESRLSIDDFNVIVEVYDDEEETPST